MSTPLKRPYSKPAITVIPEDSQRYTKLMQKLSQQDNSTENTNQADNSSEKEEDFHV